MKGIQFCATFKIRCPSTSYIEAFRKLQTAGTTPKCFAKWSVFALAEDIQPGIHLVFIEFAPAVLQQISPPGFDLCAAHR